MLGGTIVNKIAIECNGLMIVCDELEYRDRTKSILIGKEGRLVATIYLREGRLKFSSKLDSGIKVYEVIKI